MSSEAAAEATVKPYGHGDPVMEMMFGACVQWAYSEPEIRARFEADTGHSFPNPKTPLEHMIDKATGRNEVVYTAFIEWVIKNLWGEQGTLADVASLDGLLGDAEGDDDGRGNRKEPERIRRHD
jgi:hypothetical protein